MILLTYIEVLGVMRVSYWCGNKQAWAAAERVCCFAGVGWCAGLMVGLGVCLLAMTGTLARWWPAGGLADSVWASFFLYVTTAALGMLWYESLVWIGVDRSRFANAPAPPPGHRPS